MNEKNQQQPKDKKRERGEEERDVICHLQAGSTY